MQRSVAFIGAGNVSWHLAPALDNIGYAVSEVISRSEKSASALLKRLYQAHYYDSYDLSGLKADIIFLCIPDDAIEEIADLLVVPEDKILLHTSGAKSIDCLSNRFHKSGVFYPLQTFSKSKKVNFKDIPILVEGSDKIIEQQLLSMAKKLSKNVELVSSEKRKHVHLSAVFACNFSNHMMSISEDILNTHNLNIELLYPLISETINKALALGPKPAQTGPAKRHDLKTLDQHMKMLEADPELAEIYRLISQNIINNSPKD
ncbi:MAG: Rossmann-like and DUF2520 domain-containing protein [Candidatus Cyclobacteriaceae bacterium M2_1C_046]